MFSCLGRIGCLIVIVVCGIAAYLMQDRWLPQVRAKLGGQPAVVTLSSNEWAPLDADAARRGEAAFTSLASRNGPAYVNVTAAEMGAYAMAHFAGQKVTGLSGMQAATRGDQLFLKGLVDVSLLGGGKKNGPLAGVMDGLLSGKQELQLGGRIEVGKAGAALFHIDEVKVGELPLPASVVRKLISHFSDSKRADTTFVSSSIPITLPKELADVRVANGKVTLYKAVP